MNNVFRYFLMLWTYTDPAGDVAGVVKNCRNETIQNVQVCLQESNGRTHCTKTGRYGEYWFRKHSVGKVGVFVASDAWRAQRYRNVRIRSKEITEINFVATPVPEQEFWCTNKL